MLECIHLTISAGKAHGFMRSSIGRALLLAALIVLGHPAPGLSQSSLSGNGTDTAKIVLIRQVITATRAADQAVLAMETGLPAQRASNPRLLEVQPDLTRDAMLAGQKWGMRLGAEIGQELAAEGIQIQP